MKKLKTFGKRTLKISIALGLIIGYPRTALGTECPRPVTAISEGYIAFCDGFLFSPDAEQQARQALLDRDYYIRLVNIYQTLTVQQDELNQTIDQRVQLMNGINTNLHQQLENEKSFLNKAIYVVLGGLVVYAIRR